MTTPPDPANLTGPALRDAVAALLFDRNDSTRYRDLINDPAATRAMEDEIERRGLQWKYLDQLNLIVLGNYSFSSSADRWAIIRATGEQRCRAALAAVRGAKGGAS